MRTACDGFSSRSRITTAPAFMVPISPRGLKNFHPRARASPRTRERMNRRNLLCNGGQIMRIPIGLRPGRQRLRRIKIDSVAALPSGSARQKLEWQRHPFPLRTRGNPADSPRHHEIISSKPRPGASTTSSACVMPRRSRPQQSRSTAPGSQNLAPSGTFCSAHPDFGVLPRRQFATKLRLKRGQAHDEIANRTRPDQESLRHKC